MGKKVLCVQMYFKLNLIRIISNYFFTYFILYSYLLILSFYHVINFLTP